MPRKDDIKLYKFECVAGNTVASLAGVQISISPTIPPRLSGFFNFSHESLMPDSFWTVKLGHQKQTGFMSHRTIFLPFESILRFLWLKIWMNMYLYWKQYRKGLANPVKNGWCGFHASGNCVPDKSERKAKL